MTCTRTPARSKGNWVKSVQKRVRKDGEGGWAMVLFALSLTFLLGFAGFSVDLGNWYLATQRVQRAADAAALAGAPYLPDDPARAFAEAKTVLKTNKISAAEMATAKINQVPGKPSQLQVSITTTTRSHVVQLIGAAKTFTFTRAAIGVYAKPLEVGAFSNIMGGYEPAILPDDGGKWGAGDPNANRSYWVSIGGGGTGKVRGDRYATRVCNGFDPTMPDYCTGQTNAENVGFKGYEYKVMVKANPGGPTYLNLQSYDPALIATGHNCREPEYMEGMPISIRNGNDPGVRYCAGDEVMHDTNAAPMQTTYEYFLRGKDPTILTPIATCPSRTFPGYGGQVAAIINDPVWSTLFHKWVPLCSGIQLDRSKDNTIVIRVSSNNGDGMNHFLLRAGVGSAPGAVDLADSQTNVKIGVDERLPLYMNTDNDGSTLYNLVRIPPQYAGYTVYMELFDVGDATVTGNLAFTGSADVSPANSTWGCRFKFKTTNALIPSPGCRIGLSPGANNGRVISVEVDIPETYTCADMTPEGCYLRVRSTFATTGGDLYVNDATTWDFSRARGGLRLIR